MNRETRHSARVATIVGFLLLVGAVRLSATQGDQTAWEALESALALVGFGAAIAWIVWLFAPDRWRG